MRVGVSGLQPRKGASTHAHLGGVIMGTLVAFPSAAVGPSDTRQTQLALIDLEGLVFHHAPSVSPAGKATANIPLASNDPAGKRKI